MDLGSTAGVAGTALSDVYHNEVILATFVIQEFKDETVKLKLNMQEI